jgi:signal transduction histidine kinase
MPSPHSAVPWLQRQLLPAALIEPSEDEPGARDRAIDGALVVLTAALGAAALASSWAARDAWSLWLDVGLGSVACLALVARRRHPTAVAVIGLAATTVSVFAGFAALVALFNAAVRASPRALAWVFALSLVSNAVYPLLDTQRGGPVGGYWGMVGLCVLVMSVAIGWGLFARTRRELVASLHERARRLESEQLLRVEQARVAERRRIAREMHDVLAHRLSLLSLHAGALEFRSDASPDEVAQAAGVIRASGQAALEELRGVIGLLREEGESDGLEAPQPTLAQIPALIEESRAAGMDVRWEECRAATDAVPSVVGRAAFRVLQEALTNARKHAPGAPVDVSLDPGPPLVLEVVSGRSSELVDDERLPGAGLGLVGLAERVALVDGSLEHGEDAAGRFVVRATLPWKP